MERNYPILGKLGVALVFSCLALFLPFFAAKIVFAGIAGILFALCFKKFKVLMIIFFVIVMLIMSASYFVHDFLSGVNMPWFLNNNWMMRNGGEFSIGYNTKVMQVNPDASEFPFKNLTIKGNGLRINFKDDIEKIYYPSVMNISKDEKKGLLLLDSRGLDGNKTMVIDVPEIYKFDNFKVFAGASTIIGDVFSGSVEYDIDALNVQGDYTVDQLNVKCDVLNWGGVLNGGDFVFNAEAANFNADVEMLKYFEFDSDVLNGNLYFKEPWDGERVAELKASFGKFDIRKPGNEGSILHVKHDGEIFNVNVSEYNYSAID